MAQYIDKDALVAEIRKRLLPVIRDKHYDEWEEGQDSERIAILDIIDTIKVIDPYITCIQYTDRESAIKAHAEDYSWNIESELFQQLTPEQQKMWRKELEQACIGGGYSGLNLAKDPRYKENLEMKEVDLDKELSYEDYKGFFEKYPNLSDDWGFEEAWTFAQYFFELGLNANNTITEVNLESLVRQVIDLYLEAGEHYNSAIKEERKEYGGSDLAIKLFDGVIDAKELGIQYVLDKLKAQKGEQYDR